MYDVFISYSRKDRDFVDSIVTHLTDAGFSCWLDTHDLPPAEVWRNELKDAIIDADNLLFIISPDSIGSQYCQMELEFAVQQNKRIIPLVCRHLPNRKEAPVCLTERQWLTIEKKDMGFEVIPPVIRNEQKWRAQGTDYLRRAQHWEAAKGGVLPRIELEAARAWLEKGAHMDPGPAELQIRYIHESEAFHLKEAERWKELYAKALARQLAAQAEVLIHQRGVLLEVAALLAVESMRRMPTLQGDRALRNALCLLPKRVVKKDIAKGKTIKEAVFSMDGQFIAILYNDHTVHTYHCLTGEEVSHFKSKGLREIRLHPSQLQIMTLGAEVTLWDMNTGNEICALHHEGLQGAAFSQEGGFLVTVGSDKTVRMWDTENYEEFAQYKNSEVMNFVAIAPEAIEVIAWNTDKAEVFRSPGKPAHTLELGGRAGVKFQYSPDGKRLAQVVAGEYSVKLYEIKTREQLIFEERHWHAAFSANGEYFALASPEWDAHTYYLPSCWHAGVYMELTQSPTMMRKHMQGRVSCKRGASVRHDDSIIKVSLSAKGKYLATTSRDGTARVWEPYKGREVLRLLEEEEGNINQLVFDQSERYISGWGKQGFRTWKAAGHRQVAVLKHQDHVFDVSYSNDGRYVATVSKDRTCRVWEIPEGKEIIRMEWEGGYDTHTVSFSPDGTQLLLDGHNKFDVASGKALGKIPQKEGNRRILVSNDWQVVVHALNDNSIEVLDFESGKTLARRNPASEQVRIPAVHSSTSCVAMVTDQYGLCIWNWITGEEIQEIAPERKVRKLRFGKSGSKLVVLDDQDEGLVAVWDLKKKKSVRRFYHKSKVSSASLDADEEYLVTTSHDRAARIWNLTTGEQVAQFEHDADVTTAEFSPFGKYVLSAGGRSDRTARLWCWHPEDLIKEACARLSRDLTREEWTQYLGEEPYRATRNDEKDQ